MTAGTLVWLIIFAVSAAMFFIVAGIVAIKGVGDLRDLLSVPDEREND
jgi:hypothetical protein